MIQSIEMQLAELIVQLVNDCTNDNFCAMLRLVLEGLDICSAWKQNIEVRSFRFRTSYVHWQKS